MATDYAQLAKRMSTYTTNCLLTAVVLVAGLGLGRQILAWWRADDLRPGATSSLAGLYGGLGDPSRMHVMQFGDQPWSLRRQTISGDERSAAIALRASCREVIQQARLPERGPNPGEIDLLDRLAADKPAQEQPGGWRLYELDEALPMVVGTLPDSRHNGRKTGTNLAETGHRMVIWGLAVPAGPDVWTLCTFHLESDAETTEPPDELPQLPLPDGCRRTVAMRVVDGGAMVAFEGAVDPARCKEFYDHWFKANHWKPMRTWQSSTSAWHLRYAMPEPDAETLVDIRFGIESGGRLSGLLLRTRGAAPGPSSREKLSGN